jgi:hypothetical protein
MLAERFAVPLGDDQSTIHTTAPAEGALDLVPITIVILFSGAASLVITALARSMLKPRGEAGIGGLPTPEAFVVLWAALVIAGLVILLIPRSAEAAVAFLVVSANGVWVVWRGREIQRSGRVDRLGRFRGILATLHLLAGGFIGLLVLAGRF